MATLASFFQLVISASITDDNWEFGPNPLLTVFPFSQASLTDGTDTNEANKVGVKTIAVAASDDETVNLMSGLTDPRGNALTFSRIAIIAVYVSADPEDEPWSNAIVGDAASSPWETWTTESGATVDVAPGGVWALFNPVGYTVNSTHMNLMFANPNTNGSLTISLMVVGS